MSIKNCNNANWGISSAIVVYISMRSQPLLIWRYAGIEASNIHEEIQKKKKTQEITTLFSEKIIETCMLITYVEKESECREYRKCDLPCIFVGPDV